MQWQGVVPDIELPDIYNDDSYKEKSNVSALQPDKNKAGIYETLPEPPIAALAAKSKSRVAANPYFTTVSNFAAWVKRTKQQRSIPLQWQGYAAMYNEGMKMYRAISDDDMKSTSINITNNNFDAAIINRSEQRKKEINGIYISHLKGDAVIEEACQILLDWAR